MSAVVLEIDSGALIGAAIRLERHGLTALERRRLLDRLSERAERGDAAAALVHLRLSRRRSTRKARGGTL